MKELPQKVFVVFKTHCDLGFTDLAQNVLEWYGKGMLPGALDACAASAREPRGRRFVWTLPAWCLREALNGLQSPEAFKEAEERIKSGQLVWHALPFTTHTEFCGMEEFIRGMLINARLGRRYGRRAHAAKMTDVPGHTWMLPTLLKQAGVTFLHLGCNDCSMPPDVPRLFWWEGPDGSRVLTCYAKGGYGSDLVPPDDWPYPYWLAMLNTGDNRGAQDAGFVNELFKRAREELPGVPVSIGTLEDFGDAMLASGVEIPVVRGDLADTWIRGIGSAPQGVAMARGLRGQAQSVEAALSLLRGSGAEAFGMEACIDKAYESLLLFGEHTWGMDAKATLLPPRAHGQPWSPIRFWEGGRYDQALFDQLRQSDPDYQKLQQSWQEQLCYVQTAREQIKTLRGGLEARGQGDGFTVFGSLGQTATCAVALDGLGAQGKAASAVRDELGREYPIYADAAGRAMANLPLPALGGAPFSFVREASLPCAIARMEGEKGVLENEHLRLALDTKRGALLSFYDKQNRREWVREGCEEGFGNYQYDLFSGDELNQYLRDYSYDLRDWAINDIGKAGYPRDQRHMTFKPDAYETAIENGAAHGMLIWRAQGAESARRYGNAAALEFRLTLREGAAFADLELALKGKRPTPMLESGHITFPLAAQNPRYRLNKLGCVLDPERDIVKDCNRDLFCVENWLAVEDQGLGFAVMPRDMPLFSLESPGVLRYTRACRRQDPILYMQLFNNTWGTNFPQWSQGDMRFAYRLMPYAGGWREAGVWQAAAAYRCEPVSIPGRVEAASLMKKALPEMLVLALKRAEDERGFVLRMQDISGETQKKEIQLARPQKRIWRCDLLEEKQEELYACGGALCFASAPFETHTLYLED